jgi:predicted amidophosphoribosyltransferase
MFPFSGLLDLLCPPVCPICGKVTESPAENGELICSACLQKIVTPEGKFCRRCGGRRFVVLDNLNECPRCRTTTFRFKRVIALGEYENDLRLLVLRMKIDRTGILAISAAKALATHRRNDLENAEADYIVPVSMHHLRRLDRGVNSPDTIADELGQRLKIPVVRYLVRRTRSTDLQYTLSRRARAENVADAFTLSPPTLWERLSCRFRLAGTPLSGTPIRQAILGKNILLVDDILTTGSTCNAITKVLLAAGVRSVTVAVLARAEGEMY